MVLPAAIVTLPESFVPSVHVAVAPLESPGPALAPAADTAEEILGGAVEQPTASQRRSAAMHVLAISGATCIDANLGADGAARD
jgi:hypothetical protein